MIVDAIGYLGATIVALYLLMHLVQPVFVKKKLKPRLADMIVWMSSLTLLLIYAVAKEAYPFVIFFAVVVSWGTLGFFDYFKRLP